MSHAGMVKAHTHSLAGTIKRVFLTKNSEEINQFLAVSAINFRFKSRFMVFSTCENLGRLGVTFLIGRLGVNQDSDDSAQLRAIIRNGRAMGEAAQQVRVCMSSR